MRSRAKEGTRLVELVKLAMPICQQAEQACPRTGPGRKPDHPDWLIAVLIIVAIAKKKKSKSAQYRYLREHAAGLVALLGADALPSRTTYFDRYRRSFELFTVAVRLHGEWAVRNGCADAEVVAVDKSLIAARGPIRHRRRGRIRRGVDREAGWGRNEHDGWVYGFGYDVVVACGKNGVLWPLLLSVDPGNRSESLAFREKVCNLPAATRFVLADRGYDADDTCEAIEWTAKNQRTGRRFLCPTIERCNARRPRRQAWKESRARKRRRAHRDARKNFLRSKRGRQLYARRSQTVEPYNSWFKALFELEDRVWHRGIANNRTQLAAAMLVYQILLRLNHNHGRLNGQIKWILDGL